jgi:hypothetical protein
MALDEREYLLEKNGWNPKNLSGFRRSVEQETEDEYDYYRKQSAQYKSKLLIAGITIIITIAFIAWKIFKT